MYSTSKRQEVERSHYNVNSILVNEESVVGIKVRSDDHNIY